jgi:hypothetical protein
MIGGRRFVMAMEGGVWNVQIQSLLPMYLKKAMGEVRNGREWLRYVVSQKRLS